MAIALALGVGGVWLATRGEVHAGERAREGDGPKATGAAAATAAATTPAPLVASAEGVESNATPPPLTARPTSKHAVGAASAAPAILPLGAPRSGAALVASASPRSSAPGTTSATPASAAPASVDPAYNPASAYVALGMLQRERVREDVVQAKLSAALPKLSNCYRLALRMAGAPVAGSAEIHMSIDDSGNVTTFVNAPKHPQFAGCAQSELSGMKIPVSAIEPGTSGATVTQWLTLHP